MHATVHVWRLVEPILCSYFWLIFLLSRLTDPLRLISFPDLNEILGLLLKLICLVLFNKLKVFGYFNHKAQALTLTTLITRTSSFPQRVYLGNSSTAVLRVWLFLGDVPASMGWCGNNLGPRGFIWWISQPLWTIHFKCIPFDGHFPWVQLAFGGKGHVSSTVIEDTVCSPNRPHFPSVLLQDSNSWD